MTTIQEVNEKLFEEYIEEETLQLSPVDPPFCDGLLFPRTKLTATIEQTRHIFEDDDVNLIAKTVKPSKRDDYWFIKLCEDSSLSLTEIKQRLLILMRRLRRELQQEVHLYQLDRTQDFKGYFYCRDVINFANKFKDIRLRKAAKYKSWSTCLSLIESEKDPLDGRRHVI